MRPALLLFLNLLPATPAAEPELVRLGSERFRQADRVTAMTYSPDGKYIVTADYNAVHIWEAADGKPVRTVELKNCNIFTVAYADQGRALLVAARQRDKSATDFIRIDPASGRVLNRDRVENAESDGRFSPDGAWLVLFQHGDKHMCRAIETATGKTAWLEPTESKGHDDFAAFRPDGKAVAVAEDDGLILIRALATGKILNECRVEGGTTYSVAYSPDGKDLVVNVGNQIVYCVKRVEADTGKERWTCAAYEAGHFALTPDGKAIRYFGLGPTRNGYPAWHWLDAATGKRLNRTLETEAGGTYATRPDGRVLAGGGWAGVVWQWDLETRRRLDEASADPPTRPRDLRFSADGSKVRGWAKAWYEWDVKSGRQTRLSPKLDQWATELMAVSDDQKQMVRVVGKPHAFTGPIELIDLTTGRVRKTEFRTEFNYGLRFRPDGRLECLDERGLSVVELPAGKPAVTIPADRSRRTIAVSADGTTAIKLTLEDQQLQGRVWDLATGKLTAEWKSTPPTDELAERAEFDLALRASGDGRVTAVMLPLRHDTDRRILVLDTHTGRQKCAWVAGWLYPPQAISGDRRSVAGFNYDPYMFEVREVATGGVRARWLRHHEVSSAAFSPDGRFVALASPPGPVALWDLGKPIGESADRTPGHLWAALGDPAAEVAFDAIRRLRADPKQTVALLKERMPDPAAPAADWVAARIKALDSPQFRDREKAAAELEQAGELIAGELRAAEPKASPEVRERLKPLIEKADAMTPARLRAIRACEVLEGIGSAEARDLLATWAKGPAAATLTREAAESLERLKGR